MKHERFNDGLTVAELKKAIKDWPETDEFGEPCEVWVCDGQGFSNPVTEVWPLNKRTNDSKTWADLMLHHD